MNFLIKRDCYGFLAGIEGRDFLSFSPFTSFPAIKIFPICSALILKEGVTAFNFSTRQRNGAEILKIIKKAVEISEKEDSSLETERIQASILKAAKK